MIYLIDFENVHEEGFSAIGHLEERDAVYCFFTRNVAKISMSCLSGMHNGQLHFIEAESGKQSLDLALVSFLGYLIGSRPHELDFEIISNDNGFAKAADFWNKYGGGVRVIIRKTGSQKTEIVKTKPLSSTKRNEERKEDSVKASAANEVQKPESVQTPAAQSSSTRRQRRRSSKQIEKPQETPQITDSAAENLTPSDVLPPNDSRDDDISDLPLQQNESVLEAVQKPESEFAAALDAAGIAPGAADYLLAQIEKYSNDKNKKQLIYRSVVKKYGQKTGTQIYNTAKKLVLK